MILPLYRAAVSVEALGEPPIATWEEWSFAPIAATAVSRSGRWHLVHAPDRAPLRIVAPVGSKLVEFPFGARLVTYGHPGMDAGTAANCARHGLHGLHGLRVEPAEPPPSPGPAPPIEPGDWDRWRPMADGVNPSSQPGWWKFDGGYFRRQDVLPELWAALGLPPHPAEARAARADPPPVVAPIVPRRVSQASFSFGD